MVTPSTVAQWTSRDLRGAGVSTWSFTWCPTTGAPSDSTCRGGVDIFCAVGSNLPDFALALGSALEQPRMDCEP